MEVLQLEIVFIGNPLNGKFSNFSHLATSSWWTSVWGHLKYYDFYIYLDYSLLKYPHENDCTLVGLFAKERVPKQDLWHLN